MCAKTGSQADKNCFLRVFPGSPVAKTVLSMQGAWIWSLVGRSKISQSRRRSQKTNNSLIPYPYTKNIASWYMLLRAGALHWSAWNFHLEVVHQFHLYFLSQSKSENHVYSQKEWENKILSHIWKENLNVCE